MSESGSLDSDQQEHNVTRSDGSDHSVAESDDLPLTRLQVTPVSNPPGFTRAFQADMYRMVEHGWKIERDAHLRRQFMYNVDRNVRLANGAPPEMWPEWIFQFRPSPIFEYYAQVPPVGAVTSVPSPPGSARAFQADMYRAFEHDRELAQDAHLQRQFVYNVDRNDRLASGAPPEMFPEWRFQFRPAPIFEYYVQVPPLGAVTSVPNPPVSTRAFHADIYRAYEHRRELAHDAYLEEQFMYNVDRNDKLASGVPPEMFPEWDFQFSPPPILDYFAQVPPVGAVQPDQGGSPGGDEGGDAEEEAADDVFEEAGDTEADEEDDNDDDAGNDEDEEDDVVHVF